MQELNEAENTVLGSVAAGVECLMLQPTMYWKNARQQSLPFTMDPRVVYRGLAAALLNEMGQMGLQFGMTGLMQRIITGGDQSRRMTPTEQMGAAALGGAVSVLYTSPMELVMIQQCLNYTGIICL